jgi:ferredoxin-type protein NapF
MVDASRRGFFRGRPRPKAEIRPPWALAESLFTDCCTRCNDCIDACPEQIIVIGDGGYPTIDFKRGECTFCATVSAPANRWHWSAAKINPAGPIRQSLPIAACRIGASNAGSAKTSATPAPFAFHPASVAARCRSLQRRNAPVVAPASPLARSTPFRSPFSQR